MDAIHWAVHQYKQWLLERIHGYDPKYSSYSKLLEFLYSTNYRYYSYEYGTDRDRYRDGLALRDSYANETGDFYILQYKDDCSVLEMLIALAIRIDRGLLGIPNEDRSYWWFWQFIDNLDLLRMTDDRYDEFYISEIVNDWLDRTIDYNGNGGIFPLLNARVDQRSETTWRQLNDYINENYY